MDDLQKVKQLVDNLAQAIIGKDEAIQLVLVALLSEGHALLEDDR
jgi:MoxR-like ATPase